MDISSYDGEEILEEALNDKARREVMQCKRCGSVRVSIAYKAHPRLHQDKADAIYYVISLFCEACRYVSSTNVVLPRDKAEPITERLVNERPLRLTIGWLYSTVLGLLQEMGGTFFE